MLLLGLASAASAHTEGMASGSFFAGFMHPVSGLDH
ncbi:MAG: HupE/UreJ family protein, partial [Rhodoferax sp.]|nr:HupE/UreJ family protein [Rhodoferax sp.]